VPDRRLQGSVGSLHFRPLGHKVDYDLDMGFHHNRRPSNRWLWIGLIWLGFGLVGALQTVFVMRSQGMHHPWVRLFVTVTLSWMTWVPLTPLVLYLGHRFPPVTFRPMATWLVHLCACASIGLIFTAFSTALEWLLNPYGNPSASISLSHLVQVWFDKFYNGVLASILLYAGVLALGYVVSSRERLALQEAETARVSEQLSKAQLHALRQQIEPHFLFNSLNAVAALVREGKNDTAVDMIAGLSDFLRRVLEDSTRQQVPLGEEMEFAQKYLAIQKVRFAERLQLSVDVPKELYRAQVPALILQPMVENAVKHGIAQRVQGGSIRIAASRSNELLTLIVSNDGPNLPANWEMTRSGIGISNVRARLQSLYGDRFALSLENQEGGGVSVSLSLPFVLSPRTTEG
jgi:two-component system, LytTR family, sensor kinase